MTCSEKRQKNCLVRVERYTNWSAELDQAFEAMPYDEFMDLNVVRQLFAYNHGRRRQQVIVLCNDAGRVVGVVPLIWRADFSGLYSWQLLTQHALPYARFYVLPGYTDVALTVLNCYIACDNVSFYELPSQLQTLRPETSWTMELTPCYADLMKRAGYAKNARRVRRRAQNLRIIEDHYDDLSIALNLWSEKWRSRGSNYTADHKDEMEVCCYHLAKEGRLKTFSLYDGSRFVGMQTNVIGTRTVYALFGISLDEYRHAYPGINGLLATIEWACSQGFDEYDLLRTSPEYKRAWACPVVRGYRLIRGPFGSQMLAGILEAGGGMVNRLYYKLGWRR